MGSKNSLFIQSFARFKPRLFHSVLIDLIGYIGFFAIIALYYFLFGRITEALSWKIGSFIYVLLIIGLSIGIIILYALNTAFFKRSCYRLILGKKIQDFGTFFKFSIIWAIPFILLFLLISYFTADSVKPYLIIALFLLYLIFTPIARLLMQKKVIATLKKVFYPNYKIYVIELVIFIIFLIILLIVSLIFSLFGINSPPAMLVVLAIVFLLLICWSRYYLYLVLYSDHAKKIGRKRAKRIKKR